MNSEEEQKEILAHYRKHAKALKDAVGKPVDTHEVQLEKLIEKMEKVSLDKTKTLDPADEIEKHRLEVTLKEKQ